MNIPLTVLAAEALTGRIVRLRLGRRDGAALPPASPGAHVVVTLPLAAGRVVHRAYSVLNPDTSEGGYEIAVQREEGGGGGSLAMHRLALGDGIEVSPPVNEFPLVEGARHHILIAGGIGITPILAMARALQEQGASFRLDYAARERGAAAFAAEVDALDAARCWFDGGNPADGLDVKQALGRYEEGFHAYVCGPSGLVEAVVTAARDAGWPDAAVHHELFSGVLGSAADRTFELVACNSGMRFTVAPHQSILEVLEAAGLPVLSDCRRGDCGVCVLKVARGTPDHRDASLTQHERDEGRLICPCVSRSLSPELALEL